MFRLPANQKAEEEVRRFLSFDKEPIRRLGTVYLEVYGGPIGGRIYGNTVDFASIPAILAEVGKKYPQTDLRFEVRGSYPQ